MMEIYFIKFRGSEEQLLPLTASSEQHYPSKVEKINHYLLANL
jgi:hypothetical protein